MTVAISAPRAAVFTRHHSHRWGRSRSEACGICAIIPEKPNQFVCLIGDEGRCSLTFFTQTSVASA